jgi:hypothetical protein
MPTCSTRRNSGPPDPTWFWDLFPFLVSKENRGKKKCGNVQKEASILLVTPQERCYGSFWVHKSDKLFLLVQISKFCPQKNTGGGERILSFSLSHMLSSNEKTKFGVNRQSDPLLPACYIPFYKKNHILIEKIIEIGLTNSPLTYGPS